MPHHRRVAFAYVKRVENALLDEITTELKVSNAEHQIPLASHRLAATAE